MRVGVGEVPERPKGTDCKSVGDAFGGSNPPLSTRFTMEKNSIEDENLSPTRGGEFGSATPAESGEAERAKRSSTSSPLHQVRYGDKWEEMTVLVRHEGSKLLKMERVSIVKRRYPRAGVAQLVEHQPSKLRVAGSIPVSRSNFLEFS